MAGEHKLPELNYSYDALEPFIDAKTMEIHHSKHHQGYVNGLNKAEKALATARETGDFSNIAALEKALAFHGSGHFNHTLFWQNMLPADNYKDPSGDLLSQIKKDFGSLDSFKAQFSAAAKAVEGSGWGFLVWQAAGEKLEILAAENQQKITQFTTIPVMGLDVWEHAYYLHYQNRRAEYVDNWWNIVNWENVAQHFGAATQYKFHHG